MESKKKLVVLTGAGFPFLLSPIFIYISFISLILKIII